MLRWLAKRLSPAARLDDWMREGFALHERGRLAEAERLYRRILSREPRNFDALYLLGDIEYRRGERGAAIEHFAQAVAVNPGISRFHLTLGWALRDQGRIDEAIVSFGKAFELEPASGEAREQLARALGERSVALVLEGRPAEAAAACRRLIEIEPDVASGHLNLGAACKMQGRVDEAIDAFRTAARLDPESAAAHANLGAMLFDLGRHLEAEACFRTALALAPERAKMHSNLLLSMNCRDDLTPRQLFEEHLAWAQHHGKAPAVRPAHANDRSPERRLRIGYVSADFKRHSVAYFAQPVLGAHDRERLEVVCYCDLAKGDDVTAAMHRLSDRWRDVFELRDEEVTELVRGDQIDILVDLAGHTGRHRLRAFASKPAPVQVTWLGYPNTTGLEAIDYRLTDAIADPPGATERFHTEKLLRLDGGFLCYAPPPESPPVGELPSLQSGHITFGCFNNLSKVTPRMIALWARILAGQPHARLMLKALGLASQSARRELEERFASHGIGGERLDIRGPEEPLARHLALYNGVDIALDVYPYNGTTTTCEALWMGVPVVSLAGRTHVSRVGASILTRVGMPELIAGDAEEYASTALALAADRPRLHRLRQGLRARMRASPLLDVMSFTRRLESAYREMWRTWSQG